jgi:hypothetical protein
MKSWDSLCFGNYESVEQMDWLRDQWTCPHLLQSASCKDFWDHREKENLILLIENENPCSIYETWRGSGCSLHDTEKYIGQEPKTLSLLSITVYREGTQTYQIVYIGYRCPKRSKFILSNCHDNTSCLWNHEERGEEGYMLRHIFTVILQTLLFPKKSKMKAAYL